jgi:hypothetical protein
MVFPLAFVRYSARGSAGRVPARSWIVATPCSTILSMEWRRTALASLARYIRQRRGPWRPRNAGAKSANTLWRPLPSSRAGWRVVLWEITHMITHRSLLSRLCDRVTQRQRQGYRIGNLCTAQRKKRRVARRTVASIRAINVRVNTGVIAGNSRVRRYDRGIEYYLASLT